MPTPSRSSRSSDSFRVRGFFPGVLPLPAAELLRGGNSSERYGKVDPCHSSTRVATEGNDMHRFAATFYGRYWARTSDPQLVDSGQPFASVRSGSLRPHG